MNTLKLKVKKLHPNAVLPTYASEGSACFDLHVAEVEKEEDDKDGFSSDLYQGTYLVCNTGLSFEVPKGWVMLVYSRSGHGFNHDVRLANCVGVIDSDYRGSVKVKLTRDQMGRAQDVFFSSVNPARPPLEIKPGARIAQAMLVQAPVWELELSDTLSETVRGEGGFGSTGN